MGCYAVSEEENGAMNTTHPLKPLMTLNGVFDPMHCPSLPKISFSLMP
jgi:hypothetical protein